METGGRRRGKEFVGSKRKEVLNEGRNKEWGKSEMGKKKVEVKRRMTVESIDLVGGK